ncbi:hypothetical protein BH20ACI2_BH20ACI2_06640 [soil metagenome]
MLLKSKLIEEIISGRVSTVFRVWKRAGVKPGGTQMTKLGVLGIDAVDVVTEDEIAETDAREAGYASKQELIDHLLERTEETAIYRIKLHYVGEDPRKELRQQADLSEEELADIITKLQKLDAGSQRGNWTQRYLQIIHDRPNTHAAKLAASIGLDIPHFKPWVRKLKALGLTESLRPGYRLSPRGQKVLQALNLNHP